MSDKPEFTVEREMVLRALVDNGVALVEDQPGQLFSEIDRLRAENLRLGGERDAAQGRADYWRKESEDKANAIRDMVPDYMHLWPPLDAVREMAKQLTALREKVQPSPADTKKNIET